MQPDEMQLESILDECLQAIETGKATVDDCLVRYPALRDELTSLLHMASVMRGLEFGPQADPSPYFIEKTRKQLIDHMSTSARPKRSDAQSGFVAPPIRFRIITTLLHKTTIFCICYQVFTNGIFG